MVLKLVVPNESIRAIARAMLTAVNDVLDDPVAPRLKSFYTRDVRAS